MSHSTNNQSQFSEDQNAKVPGLFQFQLDSPRHSYSSGDTFSPTVTAGPSTSPYYDAVINAEMGVEKPAGKATKWESWEDRVLARQVLADDPINCIRGRTPEKWLEVLVHLSEIGIKRTADSCRARMKKLVLFHKSGQSRSLQKMGANKDVNQLIQDMDELVFRWDQGSIDPSVRQVAVERARRLEGEGQIVQDASLRGLVCKRNKIRPQSSAEDSEEENEQSRSTKKRKNDTARRIDEIPNELAREEDTDNTVLAELRDIEAKHHSELVSGLKTLAEELKEDQLARKEEADQERELRKQEWTDIIRLFTYGFDRNDNSRN